VVDQVVVAHQQKTDQLDLLDQVQVVKEMLVAIQQTVAALVLILEVAVVEALVQ
jgi:hypothetical protein